MLAAPLTAAEMAAPMLAEAATPMLMEPMLMASQAPSAATLTGESLAAMQPSLLNPATGSSYFGMEGQTPFFTEQLKAATALPGESGGGMMQGGGTSSMFGSGQGVMPQGLSTSPTPSSFGLKMPSMRGMNSASKMMGGEQQQQAPAAQRMPSQAPMSQAEIMQRLKMLQGGRSNFAGLLGQAIGGY
jgi:hypothetical protein